MWDYCILENALSTNSLLVANTTVFLSTWALYSPKSVGTLNKLNLFFIDIKFIICLCNCYSGNTNKLQINK